MHQVIDAACLLANVFDICCVRDSIPLREIRAIGEQIEKALQGYGVVVDWTKPSVMEAFTLYYDLFTLTEGVASKTARFHTDYADGFIEDEFNFRLPPDVVTTMRQTIQNTCELST